MPWKRDYGTEGVEVRVPTSPLHPVHWDFTCVLPYLEKGRDAFERLF